jgi:hypothetical protein
MGLKEWGHPDCRFFSHPNCRGLINIDRSKSFTLFTFRISELSNECGKCVVIEYISPGPFITSKPLIWGTFTNHQHHEIHTSTIIERTANRAPKNLWVLGKVRLCWLTVMVKVRMSNHIRLLVYKILQELLDMLLPRHSTFPYDQDGCP